MLVAAQEESARTSRLVIHKIVIENFKSYAGRQEIGPFHKSFSSIVGPNGSGKSNVIDAIMFVLGYRAKKMRQTKLSDLIHVSEGLVDLESCTVEVHFQRIIDEAGDGFQVVAGSDIIVSRTAYKNNRNVYLLNGQGCNYSDIICVLKSQGIDLDHKRFLILQGEVEAIAMMKPKGSNENEEGLLEYLEDIIGTNQLIEPIELAFKELESINEKYSEKLLRVRAAEKELKSLVTEKEQAENYLVQENSLTEKRSQVLQAELWQAKKDLSLLERRLAENSEKLATERENSSKDCDLVEELEKSLKKSKQEAEELEGRIKKLSSELGRLESGDVKLQETRKQLKTKIKNLEKQTIDADKLMLTLKNSIDDVKTSQARIGDEVKGKRQELKVAKSELEELSFNLQGVTAQYQTSLSEKQSQLVPFQDRIREIEGERDIIKAKLKLLQDQVNVGQKELQTFEKNLNEMMEEKQKLQQQKTTLMTQLQAHQEELKTTDAMLAQHHSEAETRNRELAMLQSTLSEAIYALQADGLTSGNAVLKAIMKEAKAGRLKGVYGRLGDLGTIDAKYDTAIATACGYLDHVVVETAEAGQACIEFLRRQNIGRANFIVLEKMQPANPSKDLPEGSQRLYDLVRVKDPKFQDAMYFALTNTLVAEKLTQAQSWAYNAQRRWRVVTLDGKLFETSGTISGGGTAKKGGMKAKLPTSSDVTGEQVDLLKKTVAEGQLQVKELYRLVKDEEQRQFYLRQRINEIESEISVLDLRLNELPSLVALLNESIAIKKKENKPDKATNDEIKKLEQEMNYFQTKINAQREMARPVENEISAIQQKILEAGGIKYRVQKSRVDGLVESIENDERRLIELAREQTSLEKRLGSLKQGEVDTEACNKTAQEITRIDEQIKENTNKAMAMQIEMKEYQSAIDLRSDEIDSIKGRLDELGKAVNRFKKLEYELRLAIEKDEEKIESAKHIIRTHTQQIRALKLHQIHGHPPAVLAIYEDEDDLKEFIKELGTLQGLIASLQAKLSQAQPNLKVLDEYRQKEMILQTQQEEFTLIETARSQLKEQYDGLCQKRLEDFMTGFRIISSYLKEMYGLITLGGNAELELVDSLDPFSEGILFSVMPPRKSWKPISNLSGGEKTLSSLALVFALHQYRPTPIYVMDEIDAALDFRNVSIIAHYIKERTQGAQFIVVSLRNNMFEMADRLVGIYKTHQQTKSVSIDPRHFVIKQSHS